MFSAHAEYFKTAPSGAKFPLSIAMEPISSAFLTGTITSSLVNP